MGVLGGAVEIGGGPVVGVLGEDPSEAPARSLVGVPAQAPAAFGTAVSGACGCGLGQRGKSRRLRLSEEFWGLSWEHELPAPAADGIHVECASLETTMQFIAAHYADLFEAEGESPFLAEEMTKAKGRYYELAADLFAFREGDQLVGVIVANPTDWNSYYVRSGAILRSYRSRGIVKHFFELLFDRLGRHGVARLETETSPSNLMVVRMLNSLQFNMTGTSLSERWGAMTRFTRFLNPEAEDVFLDQFCTGPRYQKQLRGQSTSGQQPHPGDKFCRAHSR